MQILVSPIEDTVLAEETTFFADEAVGQTDITTVNSEGFVSGDFVILGKNGSETAEIKRIFSISGNVFTLSSATLFAHLKDDEIRKIRYNQRKFYRSMSKTGTYTHLSSEGSPVNIQVDNPEGTEFEDSTGSSTSWYKATYYNTYTGVESDPADSIPAQAGDSEHYTSIYKIKSESGFIDNAFISSEDIERYREEAEAQAESSIMQNYQLPFATKPKMFQHIVTLLAAGLLLAKEYGVEADVEIGKTGQRKIDRAEALLQKIADGKIILLDANSVELSRSTTNLASNSNKYSSGVANKGEMFNLNDENFQLTDPTDPTSSSIANKNF